MSLGFTTILTDISEHLTTSLDFEIGTVFFDGFNDTEDHALSIAIHKWDAQRDITQKIDMIIEYRDSLSRIEQEKGATETRDASIIFRENANSIDEILYNPEGGYINNNYYKIEKLSNNEIFIDNRARIYCQSEYRLTTFNNTVR